MLVYADRYNRLKSTVKAHPTKNKGTIKLMLLFSSGSTRKDSAVAFLTLVAAYDLNNLNFRLVGDSVGSVETLSIQTAPGRKYHWEGQNTANATTKRQATRTHPSVFLKKVPW
jgi:hypothetical protein